MSSSSGNARSNSPNDPQIPSSQYFYEKTTLTGNFLGAIFYGIATILFFQCMGALLNPVDRKTRGIKWGLVAHTAAMFSVLTVNAVVSLDILSISYIDNRAFPGNDLFIPGPSGYGNLINNNAVYVVSAVMFFVNPCLADGFLIYRCYVIYSKNYRVMVFPCLMYLTALALSIAAIYYQASTANPIVWSPILTRLLTAFNSTSLSLNVFLTLMIATRLIQHRRNIGNAIGPSTDSGLYDTVVTMIVESFALYAVASLLYLGPLGAGISIQYVFGSIFANIQVISPFLIVLRVANQTALTSDAVSSGKIGSIRFQSRGETTSGGGALPGENLGISMEIDEETLSEPHVDVGLRM